jgi:hypothetical protein
MGNISVNEKELRQLLVERDHLYQQVKELQERGSELLLENRRLRGENNQLDFTEVQAVQTLEDLADWWPSTLWLVTTERGLQIMHKTGGGSREIQTITFPTEEEG